MSIKHSLLIATLLIAVGFNAADAQLARLPVVADTQLSLRDAIEIAAKNNLDIKVAEDDVKWASANESSIAAQTQPSLSFTSYGTHGDSPSILSSSQSVAPTSLVAVPAGTASDQNLTMAIPIYTGERLQMQTLSSRLNVEQSESISRETQLEVSEAVTEAYVQAIVDLKDVDTARAKAESETEQVRELQAAVDRGHSAPLDLMRQQTAQADANAGLTSSQNTEALAFVALKDVLGIAQSSQVTLSDSLDVMLTQQEIPKTLTDALNLAELFSPRLKAAQTFVTGRQADVSEEKGSFLPQIYGVAMSDAISGPGGEHTGYTLGISASIPIYDAGERQDSVDEAKDKAESAMEMETQAKQEVDSNVIESWLNMQAADAQVKSAAEGYSSAQQAYALEVLKFEDGKSTPADKLAAFAVLTQAMDNLGTAEGNLIDSRAKLQQLTGA